MNRPVVAAAIHLDEPRLLAYRRTFARDVPEAGRVPLDGATKALADLEITESRMHLVQGLTTWSITLHNRSTTAGYRSLVCQTHYRDGSGALVHQATVEVWTLVQPGESVQTRVIDAVSWDSSVAQSDIVIRSAEPVVPLARAQARRR
jgi:hypothetical protein